LHFLLSYSPSPTLLFHCEVKDKVDLAAELLGTTNHDPEQALRHLEAAQAALLRAGVRAQ